MAARGVRRALAALVLPVSFLAACGSASAPSPPAGVDELVIPTPSPDPDDFVGRVDNPWFPLAPGTVWTYAVTDDRGSHRLRVMVLDDRQEIAGVPTTAVESQERGRATTDYYAQDTDGNVWWFGREGSWRAGDDGARAGIAMLAVPRVGDGYRRGYAPGVVEDVARVVSLDGSTTVPAGSYDDLVVTEQRSRLEPGVTRDRSYARGTGLVEEDVVSGSYRTVRLEAVTGH